MHSVEDIAKNINDNVYRIKNAVTETQEQFIFNTICDWTREKFSITVNKQELIWAIEIVRACRNMDNYSLHDAYVNAISYESSYSEGYNEGYKQGRESIRDLINEELDNE